MELDKILVTLSGLGVITVVYWFFFGKKPEVLEFGAKQGKIEMIVDGGYKPAAIKIKKGKTTTLTITRRDPNSCLEEIILPEFRIKRYLPINKNIRIEITPQEKGEFVFHCGMNMHHGKIIVE